MEIYLSAGASTLAALMALHRTGGEMAAENRSAAELSGLMERDAGRIGSRCERAVVSAYRDLREHGAGDPPAFRACEALYRIHHPEASPGEARRLVTAWIGRPAPDAGLAPLIPAMDCGCEQPRGL